MAYLCHHFRKVLSGETRLSCCSSSLVDWPIKIFFKLTASFYQQSIIYLVKSADQQEKVLADRIKELHRNYA